MNKNKQLAEVFKHEFIIHKKALLSFAYSLCLNEAYSKDLVQETYYKAIKGFQSYTSNSNAKAWLFQILKNIFINEYRKKSKRKITNLKDESLIANSIKDINYIKHNDLRVELIQNTIGDVLYNALNKLNIKHRTILLLYDVEEFSYAEISTILSCPIGTVRSRLFRARQRMKTLLAPYKGKLGIPSKR